ncbi:serine/threonine-protein kinase [Streptacidiphilus sp. MAP12-16]|uniref:serine/threonine-protein kinase n=1 Tax=Streptacidiphilus sp. MAP12-16 TaxID=3156300 RepID=UPI003517E231
MGTTGGEAGGRLIAGRYRLLGRLGRGGMGTVWRAEDELLNRQVAVKEVHLREDLSVEEREQQRRRTLREARAVAQVRHPSVVGVHDVVEQDGEPWIVMELVDGHSLAGRIAAEGPLPPREAARIGLAVLRALAAAHARGVLHRDVKPDNVLLERETGRVVLTDFGIARVDGSATLTEEGAFLGSPEFTAPERVEGGAAGPEADLWSVGVLLCATLEGRSPFHRDSMSAVLYAVVYEDITLPASAAPLDLVVRGLLRREPALRLTGPEAERLLSTFVERGELPALDRESAGAATPQDLYTAMTADGIGPPPAPRLPPAPRKADTSSADAARRLRRRRAVLLGAGAAGVAVAAATAGALFLATGSDAGSQAANGQLATASGSAAARPTATGSATASSARPTTAAPSSSASPSAPPSVSPSGGTAAPPVVPDGFSLQRDPAGFSLAVPTGWARSTDSAGRVFYLSPDGAFRIGIHPTPPTVGALAGLQAQDTAGPRTNPGYRNGSVQATVFHGTTDAALWQWTWNGYPGDGFGARQVQDLCWTETGRSYDFWVSAPVKQLNEADHYFQIVSSTFRAG